MNFQKIKKKKFVFHTDYGQSRRGGHRMTPPPTAQDAFDRVRLVGLSRLISIQLRQGFKEVNRIGGSDLDQWHLSKYVNI